MIKYIKSFKYLFEFIVIIIFFIIFKILGLKISKFISGKIFSFLGPFFRSRRVIIKNLKIAFPKITENQDKDYTNKMWNYYGENICRISFFKKF